MDQPRVGCFNIQTKRISNSSAESFGCARLQLQDFFFSILWLRASFERMEKTSQDISYFVDSGLKRSFISLRRFVKSADLPDKLQRSGFDFLIRYGRIEVEEGFYVSAHKS
jgi:hypothetical protein